MSDTSTDKVNRAIGMVRAHGLHGTEVTLRALAAERDALRAENERLRGGVIAIGPLIEPEHREAALKRLNAKTPPGEAPSGVTPK